MAVSAHNAKMGEHCSAVNGLKQRYSSFTVHHDGWIKAWILLQFPCIFAERQNAFDVCCNLQADRDGYYAYESRSKLGSKMHCECNASLHEDCVDEPTIMVAFDGGCRHFNCRCKSSLYLGPLWIAKNSLCLKIILLFDHPNSHKHSPEKRWKH